MNTVLPFTIQDLINNEVKPKETKTNGQTHWHPSALGSCLTGVYLGRKGEKPDKDFDDRTLRVFSVGKMFENWLVDLVKKSGIKSETQVRIDWPEYDVGGYADLVVSVDDSKIVYEVKSKHSKAFWYMNDKNEGANIQHKMQLWTYLKVLNIPEGRLIYLSKDDLAILEYIILLNDSYLEKKVTNELKILNQAWKEQLPPPVQFPVDDWRAKYCRYHSKCIKQPKYLKL